MRALHAIHAPIPYANVPILNYPAWSRLPRSREGYAVGTIRDIWYEDRRATGLWIGDRDPDDHRYVIALGNDYAYGSAYLRDDITYIREHGTSWYLYDSHTLHSRGTLIETIYPRDPDEETDRYCDICGSTLHTNEDHEDE